MSQISIESMDSKDKTFINKCVCGISNTRSPYDTSVFPNNSTTFYTQITYSDLAKILMSLDSMEKTSDMNINFVVDSFKNPDVQVIFRFLCSSDCYSGSMFVDKEITELVFNFVKTVTFARNVIIELSDHSMASFFNNWNSEFMGSNSPIEILPMETSGGFNMSGKKEDFMLSCHPTLKQIGELSSDENIEITFNNMGGTKVFNILDTVNVKLISTGHKQTDHQLQPVHCEFNYGQGKIVVSATHWCNLDKVESNIDLPTLRRYCTDSLGVQASYDLECSLAAATSPEEMKRAVSDTVRQISSGRATKKCKCCENPFSCEH